LPAGTRLRTFDIVSVLGQGAFGITYLARDTQLQREVAIKEYLPAALAVRDSGTAVTPRSTEHVAEFMWGRDRFLDEARTLARLGNVPSIVRVHDFLEANGTAYMVMALAEGETLQRKLRSEGRLASPAVNALLRPLLNGLEQVHAIGFLHRDISPRTSSLMRKAFRP
jgi:serine/threonine protein kinase